MGFFRGSRFLFGWMALSLFSILMVFSPFYIVNAQEQFRGIASYINVRDGKILAGSILSLNKGKYELSRIGYDPNVRGVIAVNPAIEFRPTEIPSTALPLVKAGVIDVLVSNANGAIRNGDMITTSTIPGVGMKATKSGYVIGAAIEDFAPSGKQTTGTIKVIFDVRYIASSVGVAGSLLDVFNLSAIATYEQPLTVFKYVLAGFISLISVFFGFTYFGRITHSGIEALGRNPLAARTIQIGIFLNVLLATLVVGGGIVISYLILRL